MSIKVGSVNMAGCPAALVLKKKSGREEKNEGAKVSHRAKETGIGSVISNQIRRREGRSGSHSMKKRGAENACACGSGGRGVSNGVTSSGARLAKQHRALLKLA